MEAKCIVNECLNYHDSENEFINERAQRLADLIEFNLRLRQTFCNCSEEKHVLSINAERVQTVKFEIISGCPHFFEQAVKATYQAQVSFKE